jgi:hypothetical protein
MKIELTKHKMTRWCQPNELDQFKAAGWKPKESKEQAGEEIIRLKPPVKTKATVRAVEEANANKGDE